MSELTSFDPNGVGIENGNLFSLPVTSDEAQLVIIPVPWEVTVSYRSGTADGPEAILTASSQVDLYDAAAPDIWKKGISLQDISQTIRGKSYYLRGIALELIQRQTQGEVIPKNDPQLIIVEQGCQEALNWTRDKATKLIKGNKIPAILGGDHSSPLGLIQVLAETKGSFGILQIDAHCDLRIAYEGFTYSHASIMHNALKLPQVTQLVQVGIRDYCDAELEYVNQQPKRIFMHTFPQMVRERFEGKTWKEQVEKIIRPLPDQVYISFDIDGLDPALCPNTGTPVPGGLQFEESLYLIEAIVASGRKIIGFDLCEVSPGRDEWDANVGARLLYRLSNQTLKSNTKA